MGKNKNSNISPEEEIYKKIQDIYEKIHENLKETYQLKENDNKDIDKFNKEYASMFEYENNLYNYLDQLAGNIGKYNKKYYKKLNKELNKYKKAYEKSLKNTLSIFKKIINKRMKIKKHIEKTIKLIKELEDI
jgi:Rad3-related DNA helicase